MTQMAQMNALAGSLGVTGTGGLGLAGLGGRSGRGAGWVQAIGSKAWRAGPWLVGPRWAKAGGVRSRGVLGLK